MAKKRTRNLELQRQFSRAHYQKNAAAYKERNERKREAMRIQIAEALASASCADCGEDDPVVLEFDHRDPAEKEFDIGAAVTRQFSSAKLAAEIAKCDVVCANCHRRRTAKLLGWRKWAQAA